MINQPQTPGLVTAIWISLIVAGGSYVLDQLARLGGL